MFSQMPLHNLGVGGKISRNTPNLILCLHLLLPEIEALRRAVVRQAIVLALKDDELIVPQDSDITVVFHAIDLEFESCGRDTSILELL